MHPRFLIGMRSNRAAEDVRRFARAQHLNIAAVWPAVSLLERARTACDELRLRQSARGNCCNGRDRAQFSQG
ncbi:MAG: hypothetical protein D6744_00990 [Planctomycetota bacterium]|nr:MAG: hypothetical protein D6744_00990 [Planctomycetota bacterium]